MTVGKPSKMEPPFSNVVNNMSYVVAFESDGTAKDVTRRYAKAYNAKTRRHRVESLESGETWWRRVMSAFRRRYILVCPSEQQPYRTINTYRGTLDRIGIK